jgi:ribosomal protein S18 acetylase RimI-like enzyme
VLTPVPIEMAVATRQDQADIIPMMMAFNDIEGIAWRPSVMVPALRRLLDDQRIGSMLIARDAESGAPVGYALATFGFDIEFGGRDAFITEIFVAPPARRRGVGQALLDAVVGRLSSEGIEAIHLMVRPDNDRARALYERLGFRVSSRLLMTRIVVVLIVTTLG